MTQSQNKQSKLVFSALLIGIALVLTLVDTAVSASIPFLPGFKLGIANIVTLYALYALGFREALIISLIRCLLAALLSGFVTMLFFSISGGMVSLLVMAAVKKHLSLVKVSVLGGVAHNMAQVAAAFFLTGTPEVSYYIPFLLIAGAVSGFFMGMLAGILIHRIRPLQLN